MTWSSTISVQKFQTEQENTEVVLAPDAFSPYAGRNFPQRPLWGDSHLHTSVSVDAGTMTRLTQEQAFRFARGEEVTTTHSLRAKLSRQLEMLGQGMQFGYVTAASDR
ncbi:DUF3604 domain-containing protein [Ruegeria lacuscaerulensis]|uniref:DUF3604 domain-containing protein n=1 Tax=Ruegeria lacuscaerulensis TaxID=55218 RepID=UPI00147BD386